MIKYVSHKFMRSIDVLVFIFRGMAPIGPIAMSAGKKAALATLGMFTGVGGAVAFKLDQVRVAL
jgi:hypothetical protein